MTLIPKPELLDGGAVLTQGLAFPFLWLEGHQYGFYLGVDTGGLKNGLYWAAEGEDDVFYCFDTEKLLALDDPSLEQFARALHHWGETGYRAPLEAILRTWDGHAARRTFLLEDQHA